MYSYHLVHCFRPASGGHHIPHGNQLKRDLDLLALPWYFQIDQTLQVVFLLTYYTLFIKKFVIQWISPFSDLVTKRTYRHYMTNNTQAIHNTLCFWNGALAADRAAGGVSHFGSTVAKFLLILCEARHSCSAGIKRRCNSKMTGKRRRSAYSVSDQIHRLSFPSFTSLT